MIAISRKIFSFCLVLIVSDVGKLCSYSFVLARMNYWPLVLLSGCLFVVLEVKRSLSLELQGHCGHCCCCLLEVTRLSFQSFELFVHWIRRFQCWNLLFCVFDWANFWCCLHLLRQMTNPTYLNSRTDGCRGPESTVKCCCCCHRSLLLFVLK